MRNMKRRFETETAPEAVEFPVKTPVYQSFEPEYRGTRPPFFVMRKKREFAPYQPGETVLVLEDDVVKLCRVVMVFDEFLDRAEYYIPRYRVQTATKKGTWSKNWKYIYPGQIARAFFTDGETVPRELPAEIDLAWLNRKE